MSEDSGLIIDAAERIFADFADIQFVVNSGDDAWKVDLAEAIEANGLNLATVPEHLGGVGLDPRDSFGLMRVAGRFALAVPFVETLLAGWLLSAASLEFPGGFLSLAPSDPADSLSIDAQGRVSGTAWSVPFAREVNHLAVLARGPDGLVVALVPRNCCVVEASEDLAFDPCDVVHFDHVPAVRAAPAPSGLSFQSVLLFGSAARAQQIAGALETILKISVEYASERKAFERPIAKFQVIQHYLAQLAGETAIAVSTALSAADTVASLDPAIGLEVPAAELEIMSAKIRCAQAARISSTLAHQIHGAIGITEEHILHRLTLRAQAWRDQFGCDGHWADLLGRLVIERGGDALWPLIASR